MCVHFGGCAAITNPVANGVPVRILSDELLAKSKQDLKPIPLSLLRQQPPAAYRLAAGDILGVYIEGVLGQADQPPPVNIPEGTNLPPAFGYPMPVRQDGRVPVPLVEPVLVDRLTVPEAERAIAKAYGDKRILRPEDRRILVTLMRPRHISVLVLREDSTQRQLAIQSQALRGLPATQTILGGQQQGSGAVVELAAYENDVLHALAQTGGLPGLEAVDEAIIYRGYWDSASGSPLVPREEPRGYAEVKTDSAQKTIRIPMRMRPGEPLPFNPQDAILQTGDIVVVRAMEPQFYYTGGLLPAQQIAVPRDIDLTVVEAVLKAQGPLLNGAYGGSNLSGTLIQSGLGNPSPSLLTVLRRTPNHGQVTICVDLNRAVNDPHENILVQPGDVLILQETPSEAIARYLSQVFSIQFVTRIINSGSAQATTNLTVP
jgi:protein involved in polysaccharide export with SLBB domain